MMSVLIPLFYVFYAIASLYNNLKPVCHYIVHMVLFYIEKSVSAIDGMLANVCFSFALLDITI